MSLPGHHELHNRYRITGRIVLESALRLSSGRASDQTDAPLMRLPDNTPYIPGTSLRGALRAELERILAAVKPDGLRSCTLFAENDCNDELRRFQQHGERTGKPRSDRELFDKADSVLCHVCRLFGTAYYASRLIVEDAVTDKNHPGRIRDGVGIDRDTGAAREGVKFDYEVLEKESVAAFAFTMQVDNLSETDKQLVGIVLAVLKQGIHVGGKRAAGLGQITLADGFLIEGFASATELWEKLSRGAEIYRRFADWDEVVPC